GHRARNFSGPLVLIYNNRAGELRYPPASGDPSRGRDAMGRILSSLVVAVCLVTLASTEASAWVCRATGVGSGGWARSYSIIDAKLIALRRCEHHSPVPICTILWCRPSY